MILMQERDIILDMDVQKENMKINAKVGIDPKVTKSDRKKSRK